MVDILDYEEISHPHLAFVLNYHLKEMLRFIILNIFLAIVGARRCSQYKQEASIGRRLFIHANICNIIALYICRSYDGPIHHICHYRHMHNTKVVMLSHSKHGQEDEVASRLD